MTAHGLKSDHIPAQEMGISSAWIARGDGNALLHIGGTEEGGVLSDVMKGGKMAFTWAYDTMSESAFYIFSF